MKKHYAKQFSKKLAGAGKIFFQNSRKMCLVTARVVACFFSIFYVLYVSSVHFIVPSLRQPKIKKN